MNKQIQVQKEALGQILSCSRKDSATHSFSEVNGN